MVKPWLGQLVVLQRHALIARKLGFACSAIAQRTIERLT
jgi:hypothetical protein